MSRTARFLSAAAVAAAVAAAPAAAEVWQIDPAHSSAQFAVTHFMISTVRGEFGKMSGSIEYDGKDASSIKVDATIDAASINTRNESRDNDLKSDHFFEVAKYPTLTFKSKKVVAGGAGSFQLVGDLTMHGVTKEVALNVTGPSKVIKGSRGESRVAASATTKLNRQDYGIKWNAPMDDGGVVAGDVVTITIDIEAKTAPPAPGAAPPKK